RGQMAIAAKENTARLMPMARPSPPSSCSMNRGRVATTMPTNVKKASVATITTAKGVETRQKRAGLVLEGMMAESTPPRRRVFRARRMSHLRRTTSGGCGMTNTTDRIDADAVGALVERARREVDAGLLPSCQVALGFEKEIILS